MGASRTVKKARHAARPLCPFDGGSACPAWAVTHIEFRLLAVGHRKERRQAALDLRLRALRCVAARERVLVEPVPGVDEPATSPDKTGRKGGYRSLPAGTPSSHCRLIACLLSQCQEWMNSRCHVPPGSREGTARLMTEGHRQLTYRLEGSAIAAAAATLIPPRRRSP